MRSVIFRYEDIASLSGALSETRGSLPLPEGETVGDGEWVLAIFEIGSRRRATAAAARGVCAAGDPHLEFERRDWERLSSFVAARSEHMRAARPLLETPSRLPPTTAPNAPPPSRMPPAEPRLAAEPRMPSSRLTSSAKVPIAEKVEPPPMSEAPPRSRRFDDIPPSSPIESSRIPFGARVLVVDDGTGDELRGMLAEMGLVVELVATISSAEERMSGQEFDAIVLDLNTPGSDSRSFVGRLRADARIADIPVLFLSSKPTSRDVVDAFASGGDDFLPKPFRTPELAARIFGLLRRARIARGVAGSSGR